MNFVFLVGEREALPLRAIPFLSYWETVTPDVLAKALAWDEAHYRFIGLVAFSLEEGVATPIPALWWENFGVRSLDGISEKLHALKETGSMTRENSYLEWRRLSIAALPAGVFVWKDDFVELHEAAYGRGALNHSKDGKQLSRSEASRRTSLDFNPFVPDEEVRKLVMEKVEAPMASPDLEAAASSQSRQRSAAQDQAILKMIKDANFDALKLPKAKSGQGGIKADIRKAVGSTGLWAGTRVFDKAWQRLRTNGDIADAIYSEAGK